MLFNFIGKSSNLLIIFCRRYVEHEHYAGIVKSFMERFPHIVENHKEDNEKVKKSGKENNPESISNTPAPLTPAHGSLALAKNSPILSQDCAKHKRFKVLYFSV